MSTPSIADSQQLLESERRAEHWALTVLRGTTFTDTLKMNGLTPTREILTPEGKTITIRGSDIYDSRTWRKFLAHANQEETIYQLTEGREYLTKQYKAWLLNEHTQRYRSLASEDDLAWLERVVTLAVTRHIMEQKYHAYTTKGLTTFADPRTALEMSNLFMLNTMVKEAARLIHHIVKEPAQAQQLIEQFYDENYRQMQTRSLLMHEAPLDLPSGTSPSIAQLPSERENHE